MAGIRFIKLPGHRQFEYTPRHWDPEKEAREERIRRIKAELNIDQGEAPKQGTLRRGSFRDKRMKTKVKAERRSTIRLIVILAVLFLITYLILFR